MRRDLLPFSFLLVSQILTAQPKFQGDVLPILQGRCQICHRAGGIGPMALETYRQTRPWAKSIEQAVLAKKMPPWFAEAGIGKFSNDASLSSSEIETIVQWVRAGVPEGNAKDGPEPRVWPSGWSIGKPDAVVTMPRPFAVPKSGEVDYQYIVVPSGFTEDRWVQRVEIRPGLRAAVHHAVVYVREPGSAWLAGVAKGVPIAVPPQEGFTTSDILFTYTPGNSMDEWPRGVAKLVKAGSDLVFQIHYTAVAGVGSQLDQTSIAMVFAPERPEERVLTLQLNNDRFVIPPGVKDFRVGAWGTLPNGARLLSLYPHMHLRGAAFEYRVTLPGGQPSTLLKVNRYDFNWQLTYRLAQPLTLPAGTRIECAGTFDNTRSNPRNPDPGASVRYGYPSSEEMMIGFFDVAVPASMDKAAYFVREER